ncbi:hypothetical protein GQ44DRAFT_700883 [Phaeosphaeriaceae sp. PMI808]|nr:hypothetical protein GQ44DRAFT_700883 [Phaeosphaeriaceae sp. PMI808]
MVPSLFHFIPYPYHTIPYLPRNNLPTTHTATPSQRLHSTTLIPFSTAPVTPQCTSISSLSLIRIAAPEQRHLLGHLPTSCMSWRASPVWPADNVLSSNHSVADYDRSMPSSFCRQQATRTPHCFFSSHCPHAYIAVQLLSHPNGYLQHRRFLFRRKQPDSRRLFTNPLYDSCRNKGNPADPGVSLYSYLLLHLPP